MFAIVHRTHARGQQLEKKDMDGPHPGRVHMYSHFKPELRRQVSVMELAASGNPGQPDYKVGLPQLLDPTLLTFDSQRGLVVTGFEEIDGARFYQGWWVQWLPTK